MKLLWYSLLVGMVSNSLCYGFTHESIIHASAGAGKLGLGLICAAAGASAATMRTPGTYNMLCDVTRISRNHLQREGITSFLFTKTGSICLDPALTMGISIVSFIGVSGYGTYKCVASASESFKKAWSVRKEPPTQAEVESLEILANVPQQDELKGSEETVKGSKCIS